MAASDEEDAHCEQCSASSWLLLLALPLAAVAALIAVEAAGALKVPRLRGLWRALATTYTLPNKMKLLVRRDA